MNKRRAPMFPGFTTGYLKGLGELLLCAIRLQKVLESGRPVSDAWRERAGELAGQALRVAETASAMAAGGAPRVTMADGTIVVADLDYLDGLVRKMHRHHSLAVLQTALVDGELIAS
jgi:hypothetical protein